MRARAPGSGLRVAHVVRSDAFAGVERYVTYVAPALARRGVEVVVVGGEPAAMAAALDPAGVEHHPAATTLAAARRLLAGRPLDLVHAHMSAAEVAAVAASPLTRAPLVATRHFAATRGRSPAGRLAGAVVQRVVRREIAISRFVAGAAGRPCVVLPSGVPSRPAVPAGAPVVLMAQRLEPEKEVEVGIRAWAASGLASRGWRLVVAGEGSQEARLRSLVGRLGVAASVDLAGRRAESDRLLDGAGVLLATAPAEPFGLSVVEAMAAGVPVVAAAGGAHPETVGACSTEWLFPPGDHAACARRLAGLAGDPAARRRYGAALRDTQRRLFDLEAHADALLALYHDVLGTGPPPEAAGPT